MDDVKQLVSEGVQLFKDGKLEEAIAKLKAAVEADPSSVQAHSYLGAAYARVGENPASVEQFQAVLDLEPTSAVHTFNLGQAYEAGGSKPRAQALYEKALALDPKYARAQQRLDALTGRPKAAPAPAATPTPKPPPSQTASMPSAPSPAVTQVGQPYSPVGGQPQAGGPSPYGPQPSYGGGPQYGAPQRPGIDPSLGLGKRAITYSKNYAPSWKRFVAALIDGVILQVVGRGVGVLFGPMVAPAVQAGVAPGHPPDPQQAMNVFNALMPMMGALMVVGVLINLVYYVGFNTALGATPGKLVLSMRILKTDGFQDRNRDGCGAIPASECLQLVHLRAGLHCDPGEQ